jgi:hypothetical protein
LTILSGEPGGIYSLDPESMRLHGWGILLLPRYEDDIVLTT